MIRSSRPPSSKKLEDTLSYLKPCHNMNQNSHHQFLGTVHWESSVPYRLPPPFLIVTPPFVLHTVYGVLMRSWYHIWDFFFLCKSSNIRRNYGTLSLALENLQWTNRFHQTSF